ncbi:MAG: T9SS type A sorting domain-containing protein [Bacteroidota bacterium]
MFNCNRAFIVAFGISILSGLAVGQPDKSARIVPPRYLAKTTGFPSYQLLNINNITSWLKSNGQFGLSPNSDNASLFPRGTGNVIFQDALVWGAKAFKDAGRTQSAPFGQLIRVGGATYNPTTRPGRIIGTGAAAVAADPNVSEVRIYRIRRDYATMSDADVRRDAAESFEMPFDQVSQGQMDAIRNQYALDWAQWPVSYGAPFIDRNKNGVYDPPPAFGPAFTVDSLISQNRDEPGVSGPNMKAAADQVIWSVYNDLDESTTLSFEGSYPLGLEVQITTWGYKSSGPLGNVAFRQFKFINKGGVDFGDGTKGSFYMDSMFVAQWSDPDLGNPGDDIAGCDSILSLGYVYNALPSDSKFATFSLPPPAVGYDFFAGPMVASSPSDTAVFNLKRRGGYRNLGMSSFSYFAANSSLNDPPFNNYTLGTGRWWEMLRGFSPVGSISGPDIPYPSGPFPISKFPLSGDPVTQTGFLDGLGQEQSLPPSDRRIILNSGPFAMAPGDTQAIVVALLGGLGADRLSSVAALRSVDVIAQVMFNTLFSSAPPSVATKVTYPNGSLATVSVTASGGLPRPVAMQGTLRRRNGSTVSLITLYDDGAHGDGALGDGTFANSLTMSREQTGMSFDLSFTDVLGAPYTFPLVASNITTAGPLEAMSPQVFSDNLNSDGAVNPGEDIRYGFTLVNNSAFTVSGLTVLAYPEEIGKSISINQLAINQQNNFSYNPSDPASYFSFNIRSDFPDPYFRVGVVIVDTLSNLWIDTLSFPVVRPIVPFYGTPVTHTLGLSDWSFSTLVVNRNALKNHLYRITISDSSGTKLLNLLDLTAATTIQFHSPLPDEIGHNVQVTDGFKILRGPGFGVTGISSATWSSAFTRWIEGGNRFGGIFRGGVITADQAAPTYLAHFATNFNAALSPPIEVRFSASAPQKAYRVRRVGPNTGYMLMTDTIPAAPNGESFVSVPFQVFDVSNPASPRQLTVSWRDQSGNGVWDPLVGSDNTEVIFVHNRTYDPLGRQFTYPTNPSKPGAVIEDEFTIGAEADIVYVLSLDVVSGHVLNENPGTLAVTAHHGLTEADAFEFRTQVPPPTPNLLWPLGGAQSVSPKPSLAWSASEGTDRYWVQVAHDSLFSSIAFSDSSFLKTDNTDTAGGYITVLKPVLSNSTWYYWRVSALNPYGHSQWSTPLNFRTHGIYVPLSWRMTPTPYLDTMVVYASINPRIGNQALRQDDAIGAFFQRNDSLICAGYVYWIESYSAIWFSAFGDNPLTPTKDGFVLGENIQLKLWDGVEGREHPAIVSYQSGGSTYAQGTAHVLSSLVGITSINHGIVLPQGWNMISSIVTPVNPAVSSLLSPISSHIVLMKNGVGQVYWPALSVNTIGNWNPRHGYQIYMTGPDTLRLNGDELLPQIMPYSLPVGWSLISYVRNTQLGIDTALATLGSNLILVKNNTGQIYWPSLSINTIGQMKTGQAYQVYLSTAATLTYPANMNFAPPTVLTKIQVPATLTEAAVPQHYKLSTAPTGSNAIALVQSKEFSDGDEVAVWTAGKILAGSGVAANGKVFVTIWRDDPITSDVVEGAVEGEPLSITAWARKENSERILASLTVTDALSESKATTALAFKSDAAWMITAATEKLIPTVFSLSQNFPNPFNPTTVVRYGIPKDAQVSLEVYNILGQKVAVVVNEEQKAGFYEVSVNAIQWSSGVYFYRLTAGDFIETKKMQLLR